MNKQLEICLWGPLLAKSKILDNELNDIKTIIQKSINNPTNFEHSIPLCLSKEILILRSELYEFSKIIEPYFNSYVTFYNETFSQIDEKLGSCTLTNAWINFQKKNDYRPPHIHDQDLSFVLYVDIPEQIYFENKRPTDLYGGICFAYHQDLIEKFFKIKPNTERKFMPTNGDLFIFPAHLLHYSYPFLSDTTRISISGNLSF